MVNTAEGVMYGQRRGYMRIDVYTFLLTHEQFLTASSTS